MNVTTLGIDLAKSIFHLQGVNAHGKVAVQKRETRSKLLATVAQLSPCLIGMEACGSAQYWAREFQQLGHAVKLISPQFVKPSVKGNKNDSCDTEAICEAVSRPHMRFVPLKTVKSQDIQAIHRMRRRLIAERTALVNQIRGLLAERGIVIAQGITRLRQQLPTIVEDEENALTPLSREVMRELQAELVALDERIMRTDRMVQRVFAENAHCQKLAQVEGIGPVVATALMATIGNANAFQHGRQLAAGLGLVPRQHSTGGKPRLRGISKRGDIYLRTLLIHGARSVVHATARQTEPPTTWPKALRARRNPNIAAVALANKHARLVWALWAHAREYEPTYTATATSP